MSELWKLYWFAFSMMVMTAPLTAKPCFITNCPPGGKRSSQLTAASVLFKGFEQYALPPRHHQCVKCGPDGQGTCFGPNLCCGQTFGCYFNSKETTLCLYTNLTSSRPCDEQFWSLYLKAEMCSLDSNDKSFDGVCVADGLCCSLGHCKTSEVCNLKLKGGTQARIHYQPQTST